MVFFERERKIIEEKLLEEYWKYFTRVKLHWNYFLLGIFVVIFIENFRFFRLFLIL